MLKSNFLTILLFNILVDGWIKVIFDQKC